MCLCLCFCVLSSWLKRRCPFNSPFPCIPGMMCFCAVLHNHQRTHPMATPNQPSRRKALVRGVVRLLLPMVASFLFGCQLTSIMLMDRMYTQKKTMHRQQHKRDVALSSSSRQLSSEEDCNGQRGSMNIMNNNMIMGKETPHGVRTRFTSSGIPFPPACSMGHALNMTNYVKDISGLTGHFPPINFDECNTSTRDLDVIFEHLFNSAGWTRPSQTFDWCGGMKCHITIGKYISWASGSLQRYVQYSGTGDPAPRPKRVNVKSDRWARHLDCTTDDAWECMFGMTLPLHEEMADENEIQAANGLWSRRSCAFSNDGGGCGEQSQYLSNLFHGWMLRWTMPLNACDVGLRNSCNNNVISNINLPKSTTKRVFLSIHMRMGDACDKVETEQRYRTNKWHNTQRGRPCIAPRGYDKAIGEFATQYGVTDILLGSDSTEAIQWAKNQTLYDVHWLDSDRSKLTSPYGNVTSSSTGGESFVDKHNKAWIENRDDIGWAEVEGALEELDFLAHGQLFIGNFGSHYSRAVYKLLIGRQNMVAPFISVDGWPLGKKWSHTF